MEERPRLPVLGRAEGPMSHGPAVCHGAGAAEGLFKRTSWGCKGQLRGVRKLQMSHKGSRHIKRVNHPHQGDLWDSF